MKIRQGKDIILRWKISTNGEALPLEGRNLTLILSTPNGRERVLSYTTEGDTISTRLLGTMLTHLGDYTLTLWENRGEQGQTAVDAVNAFELVKYTTMEDGNPSCGNLEYEVAELATASIDVLTGGGGVSVEIVDNLDSDASDKALSAKQGKILNETKQPILTGDEFKTINGESIMGKGDIVIEGGAGGGIDSEPTNAVIEAIEPNLVSDALRKTAQVLTEEEKVQARKNIGAQKELQLSVKDNGNIVLSNLNGETKEFMPATPSGDPMHYAYVSAGAEYNDSGNFIVKDAPWKDLVDPIDYKAQWNLDIVADNLVQNDSITYNGVSYRYAKDTEFVFNSITKQKVAYDRYRIVIQDNNTNKWVWDDTLTLHLPKHWYLHGIGNISNQEMCYTYHIGPSLDLYGFAGKANVRTILPSNGQSFTAPSLFGSTAIYLKSCIFPDETQIGNNSSMFVYTNGPRNIIGKQVRVTVGATTIPGSTGPVHFNPEIKKNLTIKSKNISRKSVLYIINKATPISAITITLHADAYARLADDADIVAALDTKNTALSGTGGNVSLVSA